MERRIRYALVLSALVAWCAVFAPSPLAAQVSVTLNVRNPMPSQLSMWEHDPTIIQMIIIDPSGAVYKDVRASFVVEDIGNNSVEVLKSRDSDPSMPHFSVGPSVTTTRYAPELINVNAISFNSSYQALAQNTNSIPEGNYELCVTLIDQNGAPITKLGKICRPFTVIIPDPPTLVQPATQTVISALAPTSFMWTPVMLGGAHVDYQLTIAPIFQNQSPHDAIQANAPLFQKKTALNSYVYTQADPPFSFYPSAIGFAWQVQALDIQSMPAAKSEGKSEIFSFTVPSGTGITLPLTLSQYYPFDNDRIPWLPPHLIVKFDPYSDQIKKMEYTLTVSDSNGASYSASRTLDWPEGPRKGQGWTSAADTDRARYIVTDLQFAGSGNSTVTVPSWASSLKRGMRYTWNVTAKFTVGGNVIQTSTGSRAFVIGATRPTLTSPENNAVIDSAGQPVKLEWTNPRPDSLNPFLVTGMGSNMQKIGIKGAANEQYRVELSHDSLFATIDTAETVTVPSPADSTGGNAPGLYGTHSFSLNRLDTGKYFWRTVWLDNGLPYLKSDVWSFRIPPDTTHQNDTVPAAVQPNHCGASYIAALPADRIAASRSFSVGQTIKIGLFTMTLTRVTSASGTNLTGEGTVTVPYLHAPIKVEFSGLKVNAHAEVIDGNVTAKLDSSSPIPSVAANALGALGMTNSDITSVMNVANQSARLVSALIGSSPVGLPIGIDNAIDGFPMTIGIIGMTFTDSMATLNAVASYPFPDLGPNIGIGVGARGIPLQPGGLGLNEGTLYLAEDIGVDQPGSFGFRFKAPTVSDSGTYMMWDCRGFKELRLRADILFPRDWLIPIPDNAGKVAARILTTIRTPGNWMASVSMDSCEIVGSSGMKLSVRDMTYDHSDTQNPTGIAFPATYPRGVPGVDWHGFFIRSASVALPSELQTFQGGAPTINVNNLIIDGAGFTASLFASNIIQYPRGNFGSWGASIDTIGVNFVCSSLTDGRMAGRIQIPIADSALVYTATLSTLPNSKLKFLFNIHPTSRIKASVWCATLGLDPSSSIELADSAGKFWATAILNGNFSINGRVGDLPAVDLQLLTFQNVTLKTNAPYIEAGTWRFGSPDHGMAGFPITISNISVATGARNGGFGVGLRFTIAANIAEVISGSTSLAIWGKMNLAASDGQRFAFDGVDIDTIKVRADLGAVKIDGSIVFYRDDPTFGNGFRGAISAAFLKTVQVSATAQFGSVNGYRYWYVDASAVFEAGITFGPVAMYGIGGGAWYHMRASAPPASINGSPAPATHAGSSLSGMIFTPDQSVDFGLLANARVGVSGRPQVFVCSVTLGAQFVNGGIGSIFLHGDGYILSSGTSVIQILSTGNSTLLANVTLSYDFVNTIFEGDFQFHTGPAYNGKFTAAGEMNVHFDPVNWHVLVGTPDNRLRLTLLSLATIDAYIMAGTDIPAPDLNHFAHKTDIEQAIGRPLPIAPRPLSGGPASGFALGASFSYTGDFQFLVFYAHMDMGMGFDMAIVDMSNVVCSNTGQPIGINGWFGYGQLYAYVNFRMGIRVDLTFVHGDFPILALGAGALCQFQAPNPIWVQGIVGGHFSILGGLVEGHAAFTFEIGQKCAVQAENPLKIDLFTGAFPENGASNVDVFATPSVSIRFPIDDEVDLQTPDQDGRMITKAYRMEYHEASVANAGNNSPIPGHWEKSQDRSTKYFVSDQPLPELTQLRTSVTVKGWELINGSWNETKDLHGNTILQDTTFYFRTGRRPDNLNPSVISWSTPVNLQRYFLYGEHSQGDIWLNEDMQYLFDVPGTYIVRFVPIAGGPSLERPLTYAGSNKHISFPLPPLLPATEYAIQVVRQKPVSLLSAMGGRAPSVNASVMQKHISKAATSGVVANDYSGGTGGLTTITIAAPAAVPEGVKVRENEKLLYVMYFQTSKFATLADKINQLKFTKTDYVKYWNIYENIVASFSSDEWWDRFDMNGFMKQGRNPNNNATADPLIIVDAVHTTQSWFKNYAATSIYNHIFDFAIRSLWGSAISIADRRLFGTPTWLRPEPQAAYASASLAPIAVPYENTSQMGKTLMNTVHLQSVSSHFGPSSGPTYTLKVQYLHGTKVPEDFINLFFASARVLHEYYVGGADDDGCEIYGKGDWIQSNIGWMQTLGSGGLAGTTALYRLMDENTYTLDFAYSPKFSWDANAPWISKSFTYGNPKGMQIQQMKAPLPPAVLKQSTVKTTKRP